MDASHLPYAHTRRRASSPVFRQTDTACSYVTDYVISSANVVNVIYVIYVIND